MLVNCFIPDKQMYWFAVCLQSFLKEHMRVYKFSDIIAQNYTMKTFLRFCPVIILLCLLIPLNAQKIDYQVISQIKDEAFNRSQVMQTLFNLTDVSGPRLSGSTNLSNAQQWTQKQLK